jgi:NAD(P)H dehydrogenase (quinone)
LGGAPKDQGGHAHPIDRVFLPGFAMLYHERFPYVETLLRGRSARVIYAQNSPRLAGVLFRGDLFRQ